MREKVERIYPVVSGRMKMETILWLSEHEHGLTLLELKKLSGYPTNYSKKDFGLDALEELGIVTKNELGRYVLTSTGKKIALALKYIWEALSNAEV